MVDSTVLVVSHKYTKVDDLKEAKKRIKSVGGKLIGVVLNRVEISSKKYANKYYYANNMGPSTNVKRAKHRESNEEVEEVKPRKEYEYIKPKKEIKEDKDYTKLKQEKSEDKKREEKIIQDYIDDKVEDTERKIMEEIEKEKGKRFATVKEVPSDEAREILESINNYK